MPHNIYSHLCCLRYSIQYDRMCACVSEYKPLHFKGKAAVAGTVSDHSQAVRIAVGTVIVHDLLMLCETILASREPSCLFTSEGSDVITEGPSLW